VVRVRVWAAGLALLAAGCVILVGGSRSGQTASRQITPGQSQTIASAEDQASRYATLSPAESATQTLTSAESGTQSRARSIFAGLPLMFEPNQGQGNLDPADPRARFVARGSGYSLFLGSDGAILSLRSQPSSKPGSSKHDASRSDARVESLKMTLVGANPKVSVAGADPLPGKSNYLIGNDSAKWRRGIPQFARVRYAEVYPGISLVFYGNQGRLEYDFRVAPGSDPAQAELEFDGAKQLELKDGALVIRGEGSSVRLEAPRVYQEIAGRQQPVEGSFALRGPNRAGFVLGAYDRSRELVIDPVLSFSTYFGGTGDELATSVAVQGGLIYLAGSTDSTGLGTAGVYQPNLNPTPGATNVYIAAITPPLGSNPAILNYVTYLGGSGMDTPVGIAVDGGNNPYVAGTTTSIDFPHTPNAYQTAPLPGSTGTKHVFVTQLNGGPSPLPASELRYSSYLSGNGNDVASGMTIDANGDIFVTGTTTSNNPGNASSGIQFPASTIPQGQAFQPIPAAGGSTQFFVTKVNTNAPTTGSIAYSTYFGGGNFVPSLVATPCPASQNGLIACGGGIAVDSNGNIYFTGTTNFTYTGCNGCSSTDFPILNAYQPCLDQAPPTVIVNPPQCSSTTTTSFPDAFVAKLNPNGTFGSAQLQWSTYLGGSQTDSGTGIALDTGAANVYITGTTDSQDFTTNTTFASYQKCLNNLPPTTTSTVTCTVQTNPAPSDAYVARLSNPASGATVTNVSLTYFSYLGGSADDEGLAITVDSAAGALVTGWTQSPTGTFPVFPNPNTIQSTLNGTQDAFMARLNTAATTGNNATASWANYFGGTGVDQGTGIALDVNGTLYLAGNTNSTDLQTSKPLSGDTNNNGGYDAFVTQLGSAASLSLTGVLSLGTDQTYIAAGNQATFTYTLTNNGPDLAQGITITDYLNGTGVPLTYYSASATSGTCSGGSTTTTITCNIASLQSGSTATITIVVIPTGNGSQAQFNGGQVQATAVNNITPAFTSVTAQMSDYTLSASPTNFPLQAAGDKAVYQVQLMPHPVYGSSVSITVTGLPAATTSSFTTNPVTLQGTSPGATTMNISTTPRPVTPPAASLWSRRFYAIWFSIPALALVGLGSDRKRRRIAGALLLCFVFSLLLLQPACSHGTTQLPASGTPAGTYTLIVTATSGSDTRSTTVGITVP